MSHAHAHTVAAPDVILLGAIALRCRPRSGFGLVIEGPAQVPGVETSDSYLDPVLADSTAREAFFALIDSEGLVVCRDLDIDPAPYRRVGGRRGRRRMSPGEFFHHDGCSTPTKPRVVEIRCPDQRVVRSMGTSIAPFPEVVGAMLLELPRGRRRSDGLAELAEAVEAGEDPVDHWEAIQGALNRALRQFDAESGRAWFHDVDQRIGAFREPWTLRESRFMANDNAVQTVQHRRACSPDTPFGTPNGHLLKRWPAEELPQPAT